MHPQRLKHQVLPLAALVLLAMGAANTFGNKEAEKVFDDLFGKAYKGVKTTRSTADDAKLASVLIEHAQQTGGKDPFTVLLFEKSYELGSTHTSGFGVATDALQELARLVPRRQLEMQENLLRLYEIVFRTSRGTSAEAKTRNQRAGQATVDLMVEIADGKARRADYMDAVQLLTKAYQIGRVVQSPKMQQIKETLDKIKPMAIVGRKIDSATRDLAKNPDDKKAAQTLADIFIQELDRPVTAKRYAARVYDKDQMNLLQWAGQPVDSLDADQSLKLAKWYLGMAEQDVSSNAAVNLLVRARVYFERYLDQKPDDVVAKLSLTKVQLSFAKYKVENGEADRLTQSRRDRLGIQVAAVTKPNPPRNVPTNPNESDPPTANPTPKPNTPATKEDGTNNSKSGVDMSFYQDDVEGEFAERKLDKDYWKTKKSIFDF